MSHRVGLQYSPPVHPGGKFVEGRLYRSSIGSRQFNRTAVDIGEKCLPLLRKSIRSPAILGGRFVRGYYMANRPRDLADRISGRREPDDRLLRETFTLPLEAARVKAREILNQFPQGGYMTIVERWRQLPDGQIEFMMRRLRAAD